jgi:hypothetical protein
MFIHEILCEGRDAPLYHGTTFGGALLILKQNKMADRTSHSNMDLDDINGVSLSRSPRIAHGFGAVVFVLDQRRLSHNYKISPVDYWDTDEKKSFYEPTPYTREGEYTEAEEFVIGPINNVSRYIIRLEMVMTQYERMMKHVIYHIDHPEEFDGPHQYSPIFDHPLLYVDGKPAKQIQDAVIAKLRLDKDTKKKSRLY